LVPTFDGGDDFVGIGGPGEWFGSLVMLGNVAVDGGLQVDDGMKTPRLRRRFDRNPIYVPYGRYPTPCGRTPTGRSTAING
jgi:hypothetical protein